MRFDIRHNGHKYLTALRAALTGVLLYIALSLPAQAQFAYVSGDEPIIKSYDQYRANSNQLSDSRLQIALTYRNRLEAARRNIKWQLQQQPYNVIGEAFVDHFKYDGRITGPELIGEQAWDFYGKWGIHARYCDGVLVVFYEDVDSLKGAVTDRDIQFARWVHTNRTGGFARQFNGRQQSVRDVTIPSYITPTHIEEPFEEPFFYPRCLQDNYTDPVEWTVVLYDQFILPNFPGKVVSEFEDRTVACDAGDIGIGKFERRTRTRTRTQDRKSWIEPEWQLGDWEVLADCRPPRTRRKGFTDTCWASQMGANGATVPRHWKLHVTQFPDPAEEFGYGWAVSDADGNFGTDTDPELVVSFCDDNQIPQISMENTGPQQQVETIACSSRHAITYRPEVPWSGQITRTETWDETVQSLPFDSLNEIKIRTNIVVSEVDTCLRELREEEGWNFGTSGEICAYEGVGQYRRKKFVTYEDRATTGPHTDTSTMTVIKTEYGPWELWRNDCYRSQGRETTETRNVACGSGYSGHIVERRDVTVVSTTHEQLTYLDRSYNVYGDWQRVDNQCYYIATDTWCEQRYARSSNGSPNFFNYQRRTATDSLKVFEDSAKSSVDLGVSYDSWSNYQTNIQWNTLLGYDHDNATYWQNQRLNRAPWRCGDVTSSHPGVSPSGDGGSGSDSVDVNNDGIGDYPSVQAAIEAGHRGTLRVVDGGCGSCNGPTGSGGRDTSGGNSGGNGGGGFWDKVKSFFGF
jgi:hypothetical protein